MAVVPTADGKSVQLVIGEPGTHHFAYTSGGVAGKFADNTDYFIIKPDASLDFSPIERLVDSVSAKMDPSFSQEERTRIQNALRRIAKSGIWGYSVDEIMTLTGNKEFRRIWNERFETAKYPQLDNVCKIVQPKSPSDLFYYLTLIRPKPSLNATFSWQYLKEGQFVNIGPTAWSQSDDYWVSALLKQVFAATAISTFYLLLKFYR